MVYRYLQILSVPKMAIDSRFINLLDLRGLTIATDVETNEAGMGPEAGTLWETFRIVIEQL